MYQINLRIGTVRSRMLATVEAMAVDADVNVNAKNNMTGSTLLVCYTWKLIKRDTENQLLLVFTKKFHQQLGTLSLIIRTTFRDT